MSDARVRLTFPARAEYLLLARLAVTGIARAHPMEEELLADLKLAITEACGNVVRHAYDGGGGEVELTLSLEDGSLVVVVRDGGRGMTPREPGTVDGEPLESGMGLAIIGAIADEVELEEASAGAGTVLRFRKNLARSLEV
ncbi:MAG: ATP-binding protein [Gaiella sp.]